MASRRRHSSIHQNDKQIGHLRGPNGHRLCRFCKKEVQPPRKTFCSEECIHEWRIRSNTSYMREHVYKRDRGICVGCGADTRYQRIRIEDVTHECGGNLKDPRFIALLKELNLTQHESSKSLFQVDHIKAVSDGGGECGLGNLRTMCVKCHKSRSAEQTRNRLAPARPLKKMKQVKGLDSLDPIKPIKGIKSL